MENLKTLVLVVISFFCVYSMAMVWKSENISTKELPYLTGWTIITLLLIVLAFVLLTRLNEAEKELDSKCPEYEKIEVYKLKKPINYVKKNETQQVL